MLKVLAIDDEDYILQMVSDLLRVQNYEVITARGGEMGLKQAKMFEPDLILCDIEMPDINGYAVLESLNADEARKDTPFIFLTGLSSRENMRKGMEQGADDYLTKPFTYSELLGAIKTRMSKVERFQQRLSNSQKNHEKAIDKIKNFDQVTGLRNGLNLGTSLMVIQDENAPDKTMVTMMKIDNFEEYESRSTALSNAILKYVSNQIKRIFGPEDEHLFYIDKNTFVLLLPSKCSQQFTHHAYGNNFLHLIQLLLNHLSQPFKIFNHDIDLTFSLGISVYGSDATHKDELLKLAALACEKAKTKGGNSFEFYN